MDATTLAVLGIIVTVIVALATLVVAFQTRNLAGATVALGTNAERQVAEMELARRLEWTPYLTFQPTGGDQLAGGYVHYKAMATNIGRGPAINCIFLRVMGEFAWCLSSMFDLGYGQHDEFTANAQATPKPPFLGQEAGFSTLMFCQDQTGTCHLFDPPHEPQTSPAVEGAPPWADWYREQIALK
jgi:hypothetical protein